MSWYTLPVAISTWKPTNLVICRLAYLESFCENLSFGSEENPWQDLGEYELWKQFFWDTIEGLKIGHLVF